MKDKQQIEEIQAIAKVLDECCNFYDKNGTHLGNKCNSHDCEYWCDTNNLCCSYNKKEATALYEQGYRKIPEDSIIVKKSILKEELQGLEVQARKETAREILAKLQGMGKLHTEFDWNDYLEIDIDDFYKLAKIYGVEIKE